MNRDVRTIEVEIDLYILHTKILTGFKQYDDTELIVNVLENGVAAKFDRAEANYKLPDENEYRQTSDIITSGNIVTVSIPSIVIEKDGAVNMELVFKRNGKRISTYIFNIIIEPSAGDKAAPPPDDEYVRQIQISDWALQPDGTYIIPISRETHNLSTTAYIDTAERLDGNGYIPVTYMYNRELDGTIRIITDVPYTGRIVLRR